jgi:hypothetical protein
VHSRNYFEAEKEEWEEHNPIITEGYGSDFPLLDVPVALLYGAKENGVVKFQAEAANGILNGSTRIEVPRTKHEFEVPEYIGSIATGLDYVISQGDTLQPYWHQLSPVA